MMDLKSQCGLFQLLHSFQFSFSLHFLWTLWIWEDYGNDQDAIDSPLHAHDTQVVALAALLKGLQASMLWSWIRANGGISVQEAVEVSFTNISHSISYVE